MHAYAENSQWELLLVVAVFPHKKFSVSSMGSNSSYLNSLVRECKLFGKEMLWARSRKSP